MRASAGQGCGPHRRAARRIDIRCRTYCFAFSAAFLRAIAPQRLLRATAPVRREIWSSLARRASIGPRLPSIAALFPRPAAWILGSLRSIRCIRFRDGALLFPCAASKHLLEVAFLCSSFDRVLRPFVGLFFPYLFRAFGYVCRPVVCGFSYFFIKNFGMLFFTPIFAVPKRIGFAKVFCGNSSVGRAQPCQGWGREFESRFPLQGPLKERATESKKPYVSMICKVFSFFCGEDRSNEMRFSSTRIVT